MPGADSHLPGFEVRSLPRVLTLRLRRHFPPAREGHALHNGRASSRQLANGLCVPNASHQVAGRAEPACHRPVQRRRAAQDHFGAARLVDCGGASTLEQVPIEWVQHRGATISPVIAGLGPGNPSSAHELDAKKMDPRVTAVDGLSTEPN